MEQKLEGRLYAFVQGVLGEPFEPDPVFLHFLERWREYYRSLGPHATQKESARLLLELGLSDVRRLGKDVERVSRQARDMALEERDGRDHRGSSSS